jgi:hypothetical protein
MKQFRNNVIRAGLGAALLHRGALSAAADLLGRRRYLHAAPCPPGAVTSSSSPIIISRSHRNSCAMPAHLRSRGIDIITMDEVHLRLIQRNFSRRFACFTL